MFAVCRSKSIESVAVSSTNKDNSKPMDRIDNFDEMIEFLTKASALFDTKHFKQCCGLLINGLKNVADDIKSHRIWLDCHLLLSLCFYQKKKYNRCSELYYSMDADLLKANKDLKLRFMDLTLIYYINSNQTEKESEIKRFVWVTLWDTLRIFAT